MGQDPDAIRQDIEQTRSEMSETVEAVGYKADVPSRAKEAVSDKVDSVKSAVTGTAAQAREAVTGATSRAGDATPSRGEVKQTARQAAGLAKENPLGLAIGAVAIGFLAAWPCPARVEDEQLVPVADHVKDRSETGQEAAGPRQASRPDVPARQPTPPSRAPGARPGPGRQRQAERPGRP